MHKTVLYHVLVEQHAGYTETTSMIMNYKTIQIKSNEPRREKTGLRGLRPGPTQTVLYKLRKELEA